MVSAEVATPTLQDVFEKQKQLMGVLHDVEVEHGEPMPHPSLIERPGPAHLDMRIVQMRLHSLFGYLVRELGEAMQELRSKPWKRNYRPTNEAAFREEMADSFHFFVEMCVVAGITAEDLLHSYMDKEKVNEQRQVDGY